jgi:glycosyltransferase involved in cell wall biosynthesis
LKLLHVLSSTHPDTGGPIEGVKQMNSVLRDMGHSVDILSSDDPQASWLNNVLLEPIHALGPTHSTYSYNQRLVTWLREHASHYDAVIVNGLWQYHSLATWRALAGTDTPYFVFPHGMLDPWFKHAYPRKHFKKWLYWPWAEYRVLRDARAVIFTCEQERLLARQSFWLYRVNEVVSAYGTLAPTQPGEVLVEQFLAARPTLRNKRLLLFLGRLHEKKGCDLLIAAFARVAAESSDLHLVMAGPDQTGWSTTLQLQAKQLGIAHRVSWLGMLTGDEKWGAFHAAEAFCLPSHQENFGIVVAEALASGCPVLISDQVNIWREVEAAGAGLVAPDTTEGTVSLLQRWLALTPAEKETMSRAGVACFARHFNMRQAAEQLVLTIESQT